VDIVSILNECVVAAQGRFQNKGITLEKKYSSVENINADSTQIREIFMNILNNACQSYVHSQGTVEVDAENQEEMVKVIVKDCWHWYCQGGHK